VSFANPHYDLRGRQRQCAFRTALHANAGSCYITDVSVIPESTGKGLARTFPDQGIAHAQRHDFMESTLEVAKQSIEVFRMYASPASELPKFVMILELLMRCTLTPKRA
jgi:hypothetical protein